MVCYLCKLAQSYGGNIPGIDLSDNMSLMAVNNSLRVYESREKVDGQYRHKQGTLEVASGGAPYMRKTI